MIIKKVLGTFSETKDKKPFISKKGVPYQKVSVVFAEYGETIFSIPIFIDKKSGKYPEYKEGDDIKGEAGEIREYNGKKYGSWNFPKSKAKLAEEEIAMLKAKLAEKEA